MLLNVNKFNMASSLVNYRGVFVFGSATAIYITNFITVIINTLLFPKRYLINRLICI